MSLRPSLSWLTVLAPILAVLLLFAGKLLGLPVVLIVATTGSTEPFIEPYDILLAVRAGQGSLDDGCTVVYCLPHARWSSLCLTGRLASVAAQGAGAHTVVVSRASAVALLDGGSLYTVAARAPRALAWPALAAAVAGYAMLIRRLQMTGRLPPLPPLLPLLLAALSSLALAGSVALDAAPPAFRLPALVSEEMAYNATGYTVSVVAGARWLTPEGQPSCRVVEPFEHPVEASLTATSEALHTSITLPREALERLWAWASTGDTMLPSYPARVRVPLIVECTYRFREGVARSTYPVDVVFTEPTVKLLEGGRLLVENPNPVALNATLIVYGGGLARVHQLELEPFSVEAVELPAGSTAVYIVYRFLGVERSVGVAAGG